jgi:hypothetical protein
MLEKTLSWEMMLAAWHFDPAQKLAMPIRVSCSPTSWTLQRQLLSRMQHRRMGIEIDQGYRCSSHWIAGR